MCGTKTYIINTNYFQENQKANFNHMLNLVNDWVFVAQESVSVLRLTAVFEEGVEGIPPPGIFRSRFNCDLCQHFVLSLDSNTS